MLKGKSRKCLNSSDQLVGCRIVDRYGGAAKGRRRAFHLNPVGIAGTGQVLVNHHLISARSSAMALS